MIDWYVFILVGCGLIFGLAFWNLNARLANLRSWADVLRISARTAFDNLSHSVEENAASINALRESLEAKRPGPKKKVKILTKNPKEKEKK